MNTLNMRSGRSTTRSDHRRMLPIAAATVAAALVGASPVSANPSGQWIHSYKNPYGSSWSTAIHHAQLCFNVSGANLKRGYTIALWENAAPKPRRLWSAQYWGDKHKTCSPWIAVSGQVYAGMFSKSGFFTGPASADGQVWVYTN